MIKFALLVSLASLIIAYSLQYIFGLTPCILCIYERVPYIIIALLSIYSILFKKNFLKLILMCFIISAGLSFYHVGVEKHLFNPIAKCSNELKSATTIEEVKKQLENQQMPSCNKPLYEFLSISFAGWNFLLSIFMVFIIIIGIQKCNKNYQETQKKNNS